MLCSPLIARPTIPFFSAKIHSSDEHTAEWIFGIATFYDIAKATKGQRSLLGITENGIVPALAGFPAQFDHYVLDLCVLLEGVSRHILANTAFLVAAMGHLRGEW